MNDAVSQGRSGQKGYENKSESTVRQMQQLMFQKLSCHGSEDISISQAPTCCGIAGKGVVQGTGDRLEQVHLLGWTYKSFG